ncbi:hypothetical protein [Microcoleus sp. PH2017_18_LLB_O_A]|uniref:hypothetical protein n=1 Tax=Microcoleus sp. PH2017_18_LLB_O_A TaxID=2798829 RepID=UPI001D3508DB|nr:hypothetical protein [Microcoleus sp. PH2017_18_LLB_O_A]MCC3516270.1 hypothetical protein [Microcoleus sp. PH2017_18_LLB_O_A]
MFLALDKIITISSGEPEEMKAAHYEAMPKQWDVIQQYMSKDRESAAKLQALPAKSKSSAELGG